MLYACDGFCRRRSTDGYQQPVRLYFGVIRAVGLILLGWGIVQIGLSFQSHDPSQRSNGFLTLAGGVIVTFAKEILALITG